MHLLMETAISDSKDYEILSFDEVEQLKKERAFLRNRVEASRRKLALETKMRDAANSLNRLYSTSGRQTSTELKSDPNGAKNRRRSLLGSRGSNIDPQAQADGEFAASQKKVEEFAQELSGLESRLEVCDRRILEHTAGILQMTHKGLKKNIRRNQLPHSPESMTSQNRSGSRMDGVEDFDERSLYQIPDYVNEAEQSSKKNNQALGDMAKRLNELAQRLHSMITSAGPQEHFDPPPQPKDDHIAGKVDTIVKAQLGYIEQGLDAMEAAQARAMADTQKQLFDSEDQLEDVNVKLNDLLTRTNSVRKSPDLHQDEPRGKDLQSQLTFSTTVLDRLNKRIGTLVEQKDILTRQIQQQRDLNSKSDAQRDAKIMELTEQLEEARKLHSVGEQESEQTRDHMNLLMEQIDQARQQNVLLEQQHGSQKQELERHLSSHKHEVERHVKSLQEELELQRSTHVQELEKTRNTHSQELERTKSESQHLESEVIRIQTELTMAKAELDGAYGSRAQRAADVSSNLNKKNDELQAKVETLQKELRDTIEDYEVMTKQSIESEKERDRFEDKIDQLEQRCDGLETQLHEEKVKWMGVKQTSPNETTSTMVLKNEFKKMMRDTRAEQMKAFKVSPIYMSIGKFNVSLVRTRGASETGRHNTKPEEQVRTINAFEEASPKRTEWTYAALIHPMMITTTTSISSTSMTLA